MAIIKDILVFVLSIVAVLNIEIFAYFAVSLPLKKILDKRFMISDIIMLFTSIAANIALMFAMAFVFRMFGTGWLAWAAAVYFVFLMFDSYKSVTGYQASGTNASFFLYEEEIYTIFMGRLIAAAGCIILLLLRII